MNLRSRLSGRGKLLALASASTLVAAGLVTLPGTMAHAATQCSVTYSTNQWQGGFSASLTIRNVGDPLNGWTLGFTFPNSGQRVQQGWSATWSQTGSQVTAQSLSWNGSLATGASTSVGFNGAWSGSNPAPTSFTINGTVCNGGTPTTPPTTPPTTTPPPTTPPPTTPPPTTPPPTGTPPPGGPRVDNPYVGATGYVNPDWKAKADAEPGGSRISNNPTGVWMDRIAAINGTGGARGLRAHLDTAVAQGAGYIQIVIYNLPGRDCSALASAGELGPTELDRYKTAYIDPIAAIMGDAKYRNLRIINVIEIDSLPNLVTNTGSRPTAVPACDVMKANGNYVNGVGYALAKLGALPNTYNYIDAGHHGWIGWDDNFAPSATLFAEAARASGSTVNNVHGFIVNTANYGILTEPYYNINSTVGGTSVRQSKWVDWNRYVDEQSFAQGFRTQLISAGFNSNVGMLIDTSRNGWGGSARPTGPGPQTNVDTFVDGGRLDRRLHTGNWCNQSGAGIGERPRAAPAAGIDAYVWIKPPGESDGASTEIENDEGKGFDRMCDPTYGGNVRNGNNMSGALANAPLSGHWFSAQFQQLMQNAYPPL